MRTQLDASKRRHFLLISTSCAQDALQYNVTGYVLSTDIDAVFILREVDQFAELCAQRKSRSKAQESAC